MVIFDLAFLPLFMYFIFIIFSDGDKPVKKVQRFVIWICKKFNREQILHIVDELIKVLEDKNPELKPRDHFKEKHPKYRDFSADPLAPLDAAEVVKQKKT